MNERIKELLVKSGVINNNFNPLAYEQWYLDSLEKFAELIVKECVDILEKEIARKSVSTVYNQDEWDKRNFHFTLLTNMVLETKEHFGVE